MPGSPELDTSTDTHMFLVTSQGRLPMEPHRPPSGSSPMRIPGWEDTSTRSLRIRLCDLAAPSLRLQPRATRSESPHSRFPVVRSTAYQRRTRIIEVRLWHF